MTGYAAEELIGQNPRILKSGLQSGEFYSNMWAELILRGHWKGELMNRRKDGERYIQWVSIDAVKTQYGDLLYVGIATDVSELVYTRERLSNLAYYDTLTGLPNRVLFQDRLAQTLAQARRDREHFALILADLDNFKTVNDTLGHAAGDELLTEVAHRLKASVREADTVARIGGDEFALILLRTHKPEDAAKVASHVIRSLSAPFRIQGLEVTGGSSLGVTFWPTDGDTPDVLLKNADVAMYRAKDRGRNNYQFFTSDMADGMVDAMRIESGLRRAIEAGELAMYFQPQVSMDGRAIAAEALMRWQSKELGWVTPSRFIPIAEYSGLIASLGEFALVQSCRQCRIWRETLSPDFRIAVNLSAAQFRHEGLIDRVAGALQEFDLPGSALELEITESVVMEDVLRGQSVIKGLKQLGCKIAIDDFGTGYSSLAYLKRFSVDVLKIDKSFIDGLVDEPEDASVAEAIVSLARSLGLEVVAEGVETAGQLEVLRRISGDHGFLAQGYFYSPPVPSEEFERRFPAFRQLKLVGER
jgi:diguanylate cyclase (GGDEF)-like protein/PAS domain S-box-containing protein